MSQRSLACLFCMSQHAGSRFALQVAASQELDIDKDAGAFVNSEWLELSS